jgi:hypothetical protein
MRASGYKRVSNDWYLEPASIVNSLLDAEPIGVDASVWDPCAGSGNIPKTCAARGIECFASDIVDRGFGQQFDFFTRGPEPEAEIIISNPPYGCLEEFIRHALRLTTDRVIVLARLALLESVKREALFRDTPFARVWVIRRRVSIPPGGSTVKAKNGAEAYAWFVWEHGHVGPATIGWI